MPADCWALGCVVYQLCALAPPFAAKSVNTLRSKVLCGTYAPLPKRYSRDLTDVIARLLRVDTLARWTVHQLLECPAVVQRAHLSPHMTAHNTIATADASNSTLSAYVAPIAAGQHAGDASGASAHSKRALCDDKGWRLQAASCSRPVSAGAKSAIYQLPATGPTPCDSQCEAIRAGCTGAGQAESV